MFGDLTFGADNFSEIEIPKETSGTPLTKETNTDAPRNEEERN